MFKKITYLFIFTATVVLNSQTKHIVNSQSSFDTAIDTASSGDTIEWEDGTYSDIYMNVDVTDITVQAATSGGVIFNGASRVLLDVDDITFTGFQFVGGDIYVEEDGTVENTVITIDGSNVFVSHINIAAYTCKKYMRIRDSSQNTEVTYCNFENRVNYVDQNIFQVDVSLSQPGFHNINHCSFKNFTGNEGTGDDGVEPIRIGASSQASYSSKSIVEYCYFTSCEGDGEIISHKATDCIYRYNTFEANQTSELVLRHGDNAIVYGNFFINGDRGIRVREGNGHLIFNNYFGNLSSKSIHLVNSNTAPVDNIIIAYNTIVDSDRVRLSDGVLTDGEVLPSNIYLLNNIFSKPESSSGLFRDATGNETWVGNIVDSSDDLGIDLPESGITYVDPELSLNSESLYEVSSTSPAIDASTDSDFFPFYTITDFEYDNEILLDVMGSARPSTETMKEVGCQEYDGTTLVNAHATEENTGPDYLIEDGSLSTSSEELLNGAFNVYPNPLIDNILNFTFNLKEESKVKVDVYDLSGKKIMNLIDASYSRGSQGVDSTLNLESGMYLIYTQISGGGNNTSTKVQKLVKQ